MVAAMVAGVASAGCGEKKTHHAPDPWAQAADAGAAPPARCERLPFASSLDLPEASGADWVPAYGRLPAHVLVVGDSGNRGAYAAVDPDTGAVLARGNLPLDDGASDDLEGLAVVALDVFAITSSGWMRRWRAVVDAWGFELADPAYPLAPLDDAAGLVCVGTETNCGKNYEGLCLRGDPFDATPGECAGFAAAKTDGRLYCLVIDGQHLQLDASRTIAVSAPGSLTSCDFAPDDQRLFAGTNASGGSLMYEIRDWRNPALTPPRVEPIESLGRGFPESSAVAPGGIIYRFSDMGGAPSSQDRYRCR